jgi:uncharacterized membrane protein
MAAGGAIGMAILSGMSGSQGSPEGGRARVGSAVEAGRRRAGGGGPGASGEEAGGIWRRLGRLPRSMGWLAFSTLVLSVLGLVDSAYQAYADYAGAGLLACSGRADACTLVQNGPGAWLFGIRVAVYGVAFYAFMVAICSPQAWHSKRPAIGRLRLAGVVAGIAFVLYLIYTEVVRDGRICPYCTSVHVITFLLFSLIVFQAAALPQ